MRKITTVLILVLLTISSGVFAQCSTTNATSCVCDSSGSTNCDLLPDMIVGRPPLLTNGSNGIIEYAQTGRCQLPTLVTALLKYEQLQLLYVVLILFLEHLRVLAQIAVCLQSN